jgi:hypothetical protein
VEIKINSSNECKLAEVIENILSEKFSFTDENFIILGKVIQNEVRKLWSECPPLCLQFDLVHNIAFITERNGTRSLYTLAMEENQTNLLEYIQRMG